jgi:hypothetical protein
VPTKIYIFGESGWPGRSVLELNRDLNDLLQDAGEVIYDRDEHIGPCWNIDILLYHDAELEAWIPRLVAFFQKLCVLDGSISFTIIRNDVEPKWEHRQFALPPRYFSQSF